MPVRDSEVRIHLYSPAALIYGFIVPARVVEGRSHKRVHYERRRLEFQRFFHFLHSFFQPARSR
jgi:hypothetical protein